MQSPPAARWTLLGHGRQAALRGGGRDARVHQFAGCGERLAAGARVGSGHQSARRGVVQARQPGRRGHRRASQRRGEDRLRGQGQGAHAYGDRVRARAECRPAVLLWGFRCHLSQGRRCHGQYPEDRGERRHHRARLRGRGSGDPEGQEGWQVHRAEGGRRLHSAGAGVPHVRRRGLCPEEERRPLRCIAPGEGSDQEEGTAGAGEAGPHPCLDRHQVHAVQLRRVLQGRHDDRRGGRPAEPGGLREVGGQESGDLEAAVPQEGDGPVLQGGREAPGQGERPREVHRGRHAGGGAGGVAEELQHSSRAAVGSREGRVPRQPRRRGDLVRRVLPLPRLHRSCQQARSQVCGAAGGLGAG
mmetsp:Transcript_89375/g.236342  ORF Transcript_89375/g.236342 Transcript_89375/m.236342 type:complete len:358 (-) Transcript_89375:228-1301(-)